ncbi:MAG TPA: EamA family transporter [Thermoanaerobaculia bacterium]|nr:EamA family transporter [Thermoanaerobaculia bacterium]
MKHERALAIVAFAIVCIVWGTTYLGIRIAIETIPPVLMTGIRYSAAGLIMLTIALVRGERIPRDRRTLGNLALVGVLMAGIGNLSVVIAEQWVPSGIAALFVATAPFWANVLEWMRGNAQDIDRRSLIGMTVGFVGVAMLVTPGASVGGHFDAKFLIGALSIQIGCIGWQYGTMRSKYFVRNVPLFTASAVEMLIGGIVLDIVGVAIGEAPRLAFTPRTLGALAYLVLFGSVITFSAYIYAAAHISTPKLALYSYVNPVVAVILGWLILREQLTPVSIAAMIVILGGVALVQSAKMKRRALPTSPGITAQKTAA